MSRRSSWLAVPVALAAGVLSFGARAEDPPVPAAPSASASTSAPPKSLRRVRPEPTVVQVVDLGGDRDPQGFAMGVHLGPGLLYTRGSAPQFAIDTSLVAEFGLGPGSKRVPWTLEPYIAFAVPYNVVAENGGHPNRFTEFGVRVVYRFDGGLLDGHWVSLGAGAVWASRRPSSGYFDPSGACRTNLASAKALGLDCSHDDAISPGALVDIGVGVFEQTVRRARWGIGARVPVQISSAPGFGAIAFFYAQIGAAL